jgi:hypothetical protein
MFGMSRCNLLLEMGGGGFDQVRLRPGAVFSMERSGHAFAQLS